MLLMDTEDDHTGQTKSQVIIDFTVGYVMKYAACFGEYIIYEYI